MASMNDNPDKEATRWFLITVIGTILYISGVYWFVVSQDVEPTDDQIQVEDHD